MENKPDRLTLCVMAASEAGMSYGKYMALHRYHPPVQRRPPKPEMLEPAIPTRVCSYCGKVFSMEGRSHNSKYCSSKCQEDQGKKRYLEKYRQRKERERAEALAE